MKCRLQKYEGPKDKQEAEKIKDQFVVHRRTDGLTKDQLSIWATKDR